MTVETGDDPARGHPYSAVVKTQLTTANLKFSKAEIELLRRLAGEVASLAARPIEDEKRDLWRRHNALEPTRPLIICFPEGSWNEIIPPLLTSVTPQAREWEYRLRMAIFYGTQLRDDHTIDPVFDIRYVSTRPDWGLNEKKVGGQSGGAYRWESPIQTEDDVKKLHFPRILVDFEETDRLAESANQIFGDLLTVRVRKEYWWHNPGLTWTLINLRGLEQTMYDMIDRPHLVHQIMRILSEGMVAMLTDLEAQGLLSLNCDGTYVGTGGLGWSDELPQPDFPERGPDPKVQLRDQWGGADSQETVGISPGMFAEFVFPYQMPILELFGLTCYGCCEPLENRWHIVRKIPNLRRVSVPPRSNRAKMAEILGKHYIFSMKPDPADLAMESFDEERIRTVLREDLRSARDYPLEIIMKDTHTIRNDPRRLVRWVQIAREQTEKL